MYIHSDTHGDFEILLDIEDVEKVQLYKWSILKAKSNKYDYHKFYVSSNYGKILLHRYLTDCPKGMVVDHISGDTYDNRKSNLRVCTYHQNSMNRKLRKGSKTGVTGVSWYPYKGLNKWMARIRYNDKFISLGYYDDIEDAIAARKEAEERYFGEYVRQ